MRKLITVRKIDDIKSIKNADRIELAVIGGWQVVVQKGLHYVGEDVIFFEVDSFIPCLPEFDFLSKSKMVLPDGKEGYRIKTLKLKEALSQGLIIKRDVFKDIPEDMLELHIGVTLYEPPVIVQNNVEMRPFPYFIPKTDLERIQNLSTELNFYKDIGFKVTEKLDGTSCTLYWNKQTKAVGVCSKNYELVCTSGTTLYHNIVTNGIKDLLSRYPSYVLQGEIIGNKIQGNPYNLDKKEFILFRVIKDNIDLNCTENLAKQLQIKHVPVVFEEMYGYNTVLGYLYESDNIRSQINPDIFVEGLVWKNYEANISFKVLSNHYLLNKK